MWPEVEIENKVCSKDVAIYGQTKGLLYYLEELEQQQQFCLLFLQYYWVNSNYELCPLLIVVTKEWQGIPTFIQLME